jgi:hypothetical protein
MTFDFSYPLSCCFSTRVLGRVVAIGKNESRGKQDIGAMQPTLHHKDLINFVPHQSPTLLGQ